MRATSAAVNTGRAPFLRTLLAWARLALGLGCVAAAVAFADVHVPRAVHTMNATVRFDAYITTPEDRVITTGDSMDISRDLQIEALALIPRGARYAVLVPANPTVAASRYGLDASAYAVLEPWLRYLLLPAQPVNEPAPGQYVVCWGCDRAHWNGRTRWLWQGDEADGDRGQAIGLVER